MTVAFLIGIILALMAQPWVPGWFVLALAFLSSHVDASGGTLDSATTVGWLNTIALVVVPLLLLARFPPRRSRLTRVSVAGAVCGLFLAYVAVSTLWTPYRLAAAKQIAYLLYFWVLIAAVVRVLESDRRGLRRALWVFFGGGLSLGLLQSFVLGNPFGQAGGRFTSFTGPQGFAISLIVSLPLLFALLPQKQRWLAAPLSLALPCLVFLTGSRSAFLLSVLVFTVTCVGLLLSAAVRRRIGLPVLLSATSFGVLLLTAFAVPLLLTVNLGDTALSEGRIGGAVAAATGASANRAEALGTAAWRLGMYAATVEALRAGGMQETLLGSGTSSAASIVVDGGYAYRDYTAQDVDANRIVHNEWLRIAFEWGVVGLGLAMVVFGITIRRLGETRSVADPWQTLMLIIALLSVLAFSMIENLLASAGRPSGVAIACFFALLTVSATEGLREEVQ